MVKSSGYSGILLPPTVTFKVVIASLDGSIFMVTAICLGVALEGVGVGCAVAVLFVASRRHV